MSGKLVDLYDLFRERAGAVSTRVIRVADYHAAAGALAEIIDREKAGKIVADSSGMVNRCVQILREKSVICVNGEGGRNLPALFFDGLRKNAEDADMGLSEMAVGVAETGSLAGDCTSVESRLVSTLPPIHVVLMPASNIVATPGEAIEKFYSLPGKTPGYLSFITGPSRTADIERVLTIGVHGPEKLYVILVGETGGGCDG
ncbi:MAG: LutC/YkgG family protein [Bacillota bacterium]